MVDIVQLGYEVDTAQVLKGDRALDELTESTLNADAASKRFAKTSMTTGAAIGGAAKQTANLNRASFLAGGGARQIGLQLSQVAQQASVTGNVFQALTVQAADIGLAFGTIGIAAGVAVTVLGPLAASFFNNADGAATLDDALDTLSSTVETLQAPLDVLELSIDALREKYGAAAETVREFARVQAEIQIAQARDRLADQVSIVDKLTAAYQRARDVGPGLVADLELISQEFGISTVEADRLFSAFQQFDTARSFQEQEAALVNIVDLLQETNVEAEDLPPELARAVDELITLQRETAAATELMGRLAGAAANVNFDPRLSADIRPEARPIDFTEEDFRSVSSRRGGGRRADPYEANLNRLVESLETERQTLERWYEESQTLLEDRRALEFLTEQEHREALLALDREYYDRQAELARSAAQTEVQARSTALSAIGGLLGTFAGQSRAAAIAQIAINKGLSIAQAIQNTAVAQTRALAELGPIAGPPMAARIAAFGKAQIAAIAATGLAQAAGAGGSSSSGLAGQSGLTTAPATQNVDVLRLIIEGDGFGADFVDRILDQATRQNRQGRNIEVVRRG